MFESFDHNYFASDFHIRLFGRSHKVGPVGNKIVRTGWPMEYMKDTLKKYSGIGKRNLILFPHRIAPEKQPEIFRDLAQSLPEYQFVVCQDKQLNKDEYHSLLGQAKMVFSANTQETLGISPYEGVLVGAMPLVPDRLSYTEMYDDVWKYDSAWTSSYSNYQLNKHKLIQIIKNDMENYANKLPKLQQLEQKLTDMYFSANNLLNTISSYGKKETNQKEIKQTTISV
jgi:glycosyltransferase involved in cell wall biosynthesis